MSPRVLGGLGAATMFLILLVIHTTLYKTAKSAAAAAVPKRSVVFFDIIVTGDDNCYSLSRLQVYLWTAVVAICFGAYSFATGQFAAIPQTLYLLMGVNLGAAVASTAITTVKASAAQMGAAANVVPPIAPPAKPTPTVTPPNFVRDIFFEAGIPGSLDLPRTQMFLWTIVTIVTYLVLFGRHFHPAPVVDGFPLMPDVPTGMLALMGVSQGAYLGAKAAR